MRSGRWPFQIEWLPGSPQHYHGPRRRMRRLLGRRLPDMPVSTQVHVADYLVENYPDMVRHINKIKFYSIVSKKTRLRFFILWCGYAVAARERFFNDGQRITQDTGWYPMVTGHRVFHHRRPLVDFLDRGFRMSGATDTAKHAGLGLLEAIHDLSGDLGTAIHIQTSNYDLVMDASLAPEYIDEEHFREGKDKWLFLSHAHLDHAGGFPYFLFAPWVISSSRVTMELVLRAMAYNNEGLLKERLPADFFYRLSLMSYRRTLSFPDGSSVEPVETYHFPGSMGFLFTFADQTSLLYTGDLNVSASYVLNRREDEGAYLFDIGHEAIDYAIIDAAFVGRGIGRKISPNSPLDRIVGVLNQGKNAVVLIPPRDYGVFLFLSLYQDIVSSDRKVDRARVFLDPEVIEQLQLYEWYLKRKRSETLDNAFLRFHKSRSTLAESVRVFHAGVRLEDNLRELAAADLSALMILGTKEHRRFLSDRNVGFLKKRGVQVFRVAKAIERAPRLPFESVVDVDAGEWLLHTPERLLEDYLVAGPQQFRRKVFLFHNYPARLKRFIRGLRQRGLRTSVLPLVDWVFE